VIVTRTPADLDNLATRNAELRRLFVKPTVRLTDEDSPGVYAVYVQDRHGGGERLLGRVPSGALARLLAGLPDGAGPDGVEGAVRRYQADVGAGGT
jgi:hypothetical protein